MINKWLLRLIGLLILLVVVWFFKGWFFPEIPAVLQQQIASSGAAHVTQPSAPPESNTNNQPVLTLTSLEGRNIQESNTRNTVQVQQAENQAVVAQAVPPQEAPQEETETPPQRGGSWVQAGAFSSIDNANNFAERLRKKSWPVEIEKAEIEGKVWHRVFVGPLAASDVEPYIEILGKMGFNARQVSR